MTRHYISKGKVMKRHIDTEKPRKIDLIDAQLEVMQQAVEEMVRVCNDFDQIEKIQKALRSIKTFRQLFSDAATELANEFYNHGYNDCDNLADREQEFINIVEQA